MDLGDILFDESDDPEMIKRISRMKRRALCFGIGYLVGLIVIVSILLYPIIFGTYKNWSNAHLNSYYIQVVITTGFLAILSYVIVLSLVGRRHLKPIKIYEKGIINILDQLSEKKKNIIYFANIEKIVLKYHNPGNPRFYIYYDENGKEKATALISYLVLDINKFKTILKDKVDNFIDET